LSWARTSLRSTRPPGPATCNTAWPTSPARSRTLAIVPPSICWKGCAAALPTINPCSASRTPLESHERPTPMSISFADLWGRVRTLVARSELLRALVSVRQDGGKGLALGQATLRPLSGPEIVQLEKRGNTAENWSKVLVTDGFDPQRVRGSDFQGSVYLGGF